MLLQSLEGLPCKHAEKNREDEGAGECENTHGADERDENRDPEGNLDAGWPEQRVEHLAAVEWQHWQEIEDGPEEADINQNDQEIATVVIHTRGEFHDSKDEQAKQDLNCGASCRDEKTLFPAESHTAEGRVSAEGLEGDPTFRAVGPGGEGVAELVGENRDEARDHEQEDFK